MATRNPSPSDVRDAEGAFVAPSLTLMTATAPQRRAALREGCNGGRAGVQTGSQWRWLPTDLPPWPAVGQPTQRWLPAGWFAAVVHAPRGSLRLAEGRTAPPRAALVASHTLQAPPARGAHAGAAGAKRTPGTPVPAAVDTRGPRLALHVTAAAAQERAQGAARARRVQPVTGKTVALAAVDQGETGAAAAQAAAAQGSRLHLGKHPAASHGGVLLPRRWMVARRCAWQARCRRRVRDSERLTTTVAGLPVGACACLLLHRALPLLVDSA